jgi:hypothetical protein
MTDDRKLALALSDLTEEHLLAITHAMRGQRDRAHEQGNERLAEVFGSILSLALAAAVSHTDNMLDDADFRDHVTRALVAITDRDRRSVRRIAVQTRQLAEEQSDGHAAAQSTSADGAAGPREALAANLLACFRHLALPAGELRDAAPKLLRYRLLHLPARQPRPTQTMAAPVRGLALDRRRDQRLAGGQSAAGADLTTSLCSDDHEGTTARSVEPGAPDATVGPRPCQRTGNQDQNAKPVVQETSPSTGSNATKVTKGPGSRAAGLAMAFKLIEAAQARWRAVNAPHLVALVRAGAGFEAGKLVERPDGQPVDTAA